MLSFLYAFSSSDFSMEYIPKYKLSSFLVGGFYDY